MVSVSDFCRESRPPEWQRRCFDGYRADRGRAQVRLPRRAVLALLWVARSAMKELEAHRNACSGGHRLPPGRRSRRQGAVDRRVARRGQGRRPRVRRAARPVRRPLDRARGRGRCPDRGPLRLGHPFPRLLRGPSYYIEDLNSTNGTFLNGGQPVARPCSATSTRSGSATEFRFEPISPGRCLMSDFLSRTNIAPPVGVRLIMALRVKLSTHNAPTPALAHGQRGLHARSPLSAVADGMGGAQAGEVASRMAASRGFRTPRSAARRPPRPSCARSPRTPTSRFTPWRNTTPPAPKAGDRCSPRRSWTATTSSSATSATAAPTACATAS